LVILKFKITYSRSAKISKIQHVQISSHTSTPTYIILIIVNFRFTVGWAELATPNIIT